ncbi:peptidase [Pyricularia oryzae]|nr:peptidase [Pyricularia oryzae]
MRAFTTLYFVVGLVATKAMALFVGFPQQSQPDAPPRDPSIPETGNICCAPTGVADPSLTCKNAGLNSFCCINARNDFFDPDGGKGGCDRFTNFNTGRSVQKFVPNSQKTCFSGNEAGFIGCA